MMLGDSIAQLFTALGNAIINSIWQFAILWLLCFLIFFLNKIRAQMKFIIAFIFQCLGFFGFVVTFLNGLLLPNRSGISLQFFYLNETPLSFIQLFNPLFLTTISLLYIIVVIGLLVQNSILYFRSKFFTENNKETISHEWNLFTQKMAIKLRIKQPVKLHLSALATSPFTIGFWKPAIIIPLSVMNNLRTEELEAILLHELAHIKRHDYLLNLLLIVMDTLLFFNPFSKLISNQIKQERENACDDLVIHYSCESKVYAGALLQLAKIQDKQYQHFSLYATSDNNMHLFNRIKRIVGQPKKVEMNIRLMIRYFLLIILSVSLFFLGTGHKKSNSTFVTRTNALPKSSIEPLQASIHSKIINNTVISSPIPTKNSPPTYKPILPSSTEQNLENLNDAIYKTEGDEFTLFENAEQPFNIVPSNNSEVDQIWNEVQKEINETLRNALGAAKSNNISINEITLKSMILAKIRSRMAEIKDNHSERNAISIALLSNLEKKIAADVLSSVIVNESSSIFQKKNNLTIQYDLPIDQNGNVYRLEYIIESRQKMDSMPELSISTPTISSDSAKQNNTQILKSNKRKIRI